MSQELEGRREMGWNLVAGRQENKFCGSARIEKGGQSLSVSGGREVAVRELGERG